MGSPYREIEPDLHVLNSRIQAEPHRRGAILIEEYQRAVKAGDLDKARSLLLMRDILDARSVPDQRTTIFHITAANVNFGQQTGKITATLNSLLAENPDATKIVDAITALTEGVLSSKDLQDTQKNDALEALEFIGKEAQAGPENRRTGVLKSVLASLSEIISSASGLLSLWQTFGPQIKLFFGL